MQRFVSLPLCLLGVSLLIGCTNQEDSGTRNLTTPPTASSETPPSGFPKAIAPKLIALPKASIPAEFRKLLPKDIAIANAWDVHLVFPDGWQAWLVSGTYEKGRGNVWVVTDHGIDHLDNSFTWRTLRPNEHRISADDGKPLPHLPQPKITWVGYVPESGRGSDGAKKPWTLYLSDSTTYRKGPENWEQNWEQTWQCIPRLEDGKLLKEGLLFFPSQKE